MLLKFLRFELNCCLLYFVSFTLHYWKISRGRICIAKFSGSHANHCAKAPIILALYFILLDCFIFTLFRLTLRSSVQGVFFIFLLNHCWWRWSGFLYFLFVNEVNSFDKVVNNHLLSPKTFQRFYQTMQVIIYIIKESWIFMIIILWYISDIMYLVILLVLILNSL